MYTMKDWERDGTFSAEIGELVEEAIIWEFSGCVPPLSFTRDYLQVGEPWGCDATLNALLFTTFERTAQGWVYRGHCLMDRTENRLSYYESKTLKS